MRNKGVTPLRRTEDLVVRSHGEETLILDRRTDTAHCLSPQVTRVWAACTGTSTLEEIASAAGIDEAATASAVDQLMERDLVAVPAGADRRQFLRRTALIGAGAVTVTGITSVFGPMAAAAASPAISVPIAPGASPTCSNALSAGSPQRTVTFSISLAGFAAGTYTVTASPTSAVPFVTSGRAEIVNFGSVVVASSGGTEVTSAQPIVDPNGGLLPAIIPLVVTITEIPSGSPIIAVISFNNPCCPGGCIA